MIVKPVDFWEHSILIMTKFEIISALVAYYSTVPCKLVSQLNSATS